MLSRQRLVAVVSLVLNGVALTGVDAPVAATAPSPAPVLAAPAAAAMISMDGGDVITLSTPRSVLAPSRVGTAWHRVSAATRADLPTIGVAAVLVSVSVSGAGSGGTVMVRPTGAPSAGQGVAAYGTRSTSGLTLVKLGSSDAIDIRTTAGRPSVGVRIVGYVPELAPLVVSETAATSVTADLSTTTRAVQLAGQGIGPLDGHRTRRRGHHQPRPHPGVPAHLATRVDGGQRRPCLPERVATSPWPRSGRTPTGSSACGLRAGCAPASASSAGPRGRRR